VTADPRLLARFDGNAGCWRIAAGRYRVALVKSVEDLQLTADVQLAMRLFGTPDTEQPVQDGPLIYRLLTVKRMIIGRFEDFWPSTG